MAPAPRSAARAPGQPGALVTAAQPANVDTVIVDGRVLKRGGVLTAIDLPQVREDAQRALAGVLDRAGNSWQ